MAPVGTGPGQMCAPDVGQGGLQGTKEMWNAAGPAGLGCALHHGLPPLPQTQQAWVPDVSAGKERQGEESCQQAETAVAPTPHSSPACDKVPPRSPALYLVHSGASEVPVALRHHETERSLEPR